MDHTLGLCQDGTVLAAGEGLFGSCAVSKWNHITFIAAGHIHTIGINQMGRIQEADGFAAPGVMDWSDISRVAVSPFHTVGLKKDGTVLASGDIQYGQCQVETWSHITNVAAGERHTVGLKKMALSLRPGTTRLTSVPLMGGVFGKNTKNLEIIPLWNSPITG